MNTEDRVFISTSCIGGRTTYKNAIDSILSTSINNIEISGNHYYLDNFELIKLIKYYQKIKVNFSFHNYFPTPSNEIVMNLLSQSKQIYNESFHVIENAFRLSKETDIKIYGVHPGYFRDAMIDNGKFKFIGNRISINESIEFYMNKFQNNFKNLQLINNDIFFGLENLFPNFDKTNDSFMCTFEEIESILNIPYINKSNIGIILDLGHLNISSNLLEFDKYYFLSSRFSSVIFFTEHLTIFFYCFSSFMPWFNVISFHIRYIKTVSTYCAFTLLFFISFLFHGI